MASADTKRKLMTLGVFATPMILVMVAKSYFGTPGPTAAQATPIEETSPDKSKKNAVKAPTFTERQIVAARYADSVRTQPMGGSPFYFESRNTTVTTPKSDGPVDPVAFDPGIPQFTVQAILASSSGKTALIDGKPCRENEKIRGTDWEVETIDPDGRSVTLHDTKRERTVTVTVETPKLDSGKSN
jgi:hypothetical protein